MPAQARALVELMRSSSVSGIWTTPQCSCGLWEMTVIHGMLESWRVLCWWKKSPCLCCAFQDECTRWITPNVGCSAARRCKDGSEEEEKSEGSGEITGLLCWAAAFKVKVIKAQCKIAGAGTCRLTWVTISTILGRGTAEVCRRKNRLVFWKVWFWAGK